MVIAGITRRSIGAGEMERRYTDFYGRRERIPGHRARRIEKCFGLSDAITRGNRRTSMTSPSRCGTGHAFNETTS